MKRRDRGLTHIDARGKARMVDVSGKSPTVRCAVASAEVRVGRAILRRIASGTVAKGDVIATARLAGIQAAKRTAELIPLCHGLAPEFVDVRIDPRPPERLHVVAEARIEAKTGVEMEALVAASVAALTIYDMCKALSKGITIGPIRLESKTGGKSGDWRRAPTADDG